MNTHSRARSLARTHLSFSGLSMHLIFFDVYTYVALQFYYVYMTNVYMTNLFIFCILLVPSYPSRFLALSLVCRRFLVSWLTSIS